MPSSTGRDLPRTTVGSIDARGRTMLTRLAADARDSPHRLGTLLVRHLRAPFGDDAVVYVSDLQQSRLVAYPRHGLSTPPDLDIDGTVAGRCFRLSSPQRGGSLHSTADVDLTGQPSRVVTWWPLLDGSERLGVLGVELRAEDADHPDVVGWLAELADATAGMVMAGQRVSDTVTRLRRTRDMDIAAEIQWALLPPLTFEDAHQSISGALEPAYSVAGDTFDYAVEEGVTRFAILDAVGHGLDSALLATLAVSAYRNARRRGRSLTETAQDVDADLERVDRRHRFVTGVLGELDVGTGVLRWLNAGHISPVLLRGNRSAAELAAPPHHPLGLGLGGQQWVVQETRLEPGDRLLLCTDGVLDARSPDGAFFGLDRLVDLVRRQSASGMSAAEVLRSVVHALLAHQQGRLQDDATIVLLQWRPPAGDHRTPV
jgi:serine phosphatase RsbU (regulator of sigma subunit)